MTKTVKVYTWTTCSHCVRVKNLLNDKGILFEEVNLDGQDDELKALQAKTGYRTVPQIFIGDEFIGGFQDLSKLEANGALDEKLQS